MEGSSPTQEADYNYKEIPLCEDVTFPPANVSNDTIMCHDAYYEELDEHFWAFLQWFFILLSGIVLVIGLAGNGLVCFAVWRNPRMRSATNIFLVNLAVADFMVILICLIPTTTENILEKWYLGSEMCKIVKCLQKTSVCVSVLTLTAISLERWMAICRPLFFRQTSVRALRTIAIVWFISIGASVPDAISLEVIDGMCRPTRLERDETIYLWIIFVFLYAVPLCIMTFTYTKVALVLWQSGFLEDDNEASATVPRAQMLLRRKKAKMLIVVVALFAFCYLPVHLLFLMSNTGFEITSITVAKPLYMTSHWLCYFNSAVNPAIYNFMSRNFRHEFSIACHICCRRGSNHNSVYEAVRLRKFTKYQNRKEHNAANRPSCVNDNSYTLQTQSTLLSPSASSVCNLGLRHHPSTSSLAVPNADIALRTDGNSSRLPRRSSEVEARRSKFQVLRDTLLCSKLSPVDSV